MNITFVINVYVIKVLFSIQSKFERYLVDLAVLAGV